MKCIIHYKYHIYFIGILQEENLSEASFDEETEELDSCKEIGNDISDEDDYVPQAFVEPKVSNLSIPSLVANYESEEEGKYRQI